MFDSPTLTRLDQERISKKGKEYSEIGKKIPVGIIVEFTGSDCTVNVDYLGLLGGGDLAFTIIDKYQHIKKVVEEIASSLGADRVDNHILFKKFYFTLLNCERSEVEKKLNEEKYKILDVVDPERKLYETEVETVVKPL